MTKPVMRIYSTSLLPERNPAWKSLQERYSLEFADYGVWVQEFWQPEVCSGQDYLFFYIDFADLFGRKELSELLSEESSLVEVIAPLNALLKSRTKPILLSFSCFSFANDSVISRARNHTDRQSLERIFRESLFSLCEKNSHLFVVDYDKENLWGGLAELFDSRMFYTGHCRFTLKGLRRLTESLSQVMDRIESARKKLLILDCDNTLWGGVMGEDGLEGIQIGQDGIGLAFQDFQLEAKNLANSGILLALCSKNIEEDVLQVLNEHQGMILRESDITAFKVNWQDKAQNISELATELGLGLDSFVFWDDNPVERDMVRSTLPMVEVVEPSENVTDWPQQLRTLCSLHQFSYSKEDSKKRLQYEARRKFNRELNQEVDKVSYLQSIRMQPTALRVEASNLDRAEQLCQKTNQFNLRTVRHSRSFFTEIASEESFQTKLYALEDKFGDHGIVGLTISKIISPKAAFLDTCLMSCRVIGRYFESWMLAECIDSLKKQDIRYIFAEYIPSERNIVVSEFLKENGFHELNEAKSEVGQEAGSIEWAQDGVSFYFDTQEDKIPNLEVFRDE